VKVYASCSSYALGCVLGPYEASRAISVAVADVKQAEIIPGVAVLRKLRELAELELRVDGGATQIAKCRSRHFDAALKSDAELWFTVDDDIDATLPTLALLLEAVSDDAPRVCFAPYLQRGTDKVLVTWPEVTSERRLQGGRVRSALYGGFGLVVVNRPAMHLVARDAPTFFDAVGDEVPKSAAFLETITKEGYWLGEDFAFFERARRAGVIVEALVDGRVQHAGATLDLSTL